MKQNYWNLNKGENHALLNVGTEMLLRLCQVEDQNTSVQKTIDKIFERLEFLSNQLSL
jgi:hypothetical protein